MTSESNHATIAIALLITKFTGNFCSLPPVNQPCPWPIAGIPDGCGPIISHIFALWLLLLLTVPFAGALPANKFGGSNPADHEAARPQTGALQLRHATGGSGVKKLAKIDYNFTE